MINRTIIVGRLTADPELRYTPSNVAVLSFSIACQRNLPNKDGEREADFIDCVAWRQTAEFIAKYFVKGEQIGVQGRLATRVYKGKDEKNHKVTELVVDEVSFIESKRKQANINSEDDTEGRFVEFDSNDDLPF